MPWNQFVLAPTWVTYADLCTHWARSIGGSVVECSPAILWIMQTAGGPGSIPGRCSSFFHCEQYVPHKTQGSVTKTHCSAIALSPICFRVQKGRIREVIEWYEDCIHFVPASSIARLGSGGGWGGGGGGGGGVNDDDHNGKIDFVDIVISHLDSDWSSFRSCTGYFRLTTIAGTYWGHQA